MINLVVALIHEARPLIDHYKMIKLKGNHPFTLYTCAELTLIISGIGKLSAAAATGYLQSYTFNKGPVAWLNFGIAGHSQRDIGQEFIAHRVLDLATGQVFYPPRILPFPCPSSDLVTTDQPEKDYEDDSGYDMEASGYYKIALRSCTIEWIHCYKVVSDNPQHPIEKMTKEFVIHLVSSRIKVLETILSMLSKEVDRYRKIYAPSHEFGEITERWHFTETQKSQLLRLLQRWQTHFGNTLSSQTDLSSYRDAKVFLEALKQQLDSYNMIV